MTKGKIVARIQTDVPSELKKWLQFRAIETGRTQGDLIVEALQRYRDEVDPPTPPQSKPTA